MADPIGRGWLDQPLTRADALAMIVGFFAPRVAERLLGEAAAMVLVGVVIVALLVVIWLRRRREGSHG